MKYVMILCAVVACFLAMACTSPMTSYPPTAVLLGPVYDIAHDALSISWTVNTDIDFAKYELYRSDASGVSIDDTLIASIADQADTIFRDTNLNANKKYYYRVWVYKTDGKSTPSNETSGTTGYDAPPSAITLQDPGDVTDTSMTLSWGPSLVPDFGWYRLYRSESPTVNDAAVLVYETTDRNATFYADSSLSSNVTYYYRVYVVDSWGIAAGSNIVFETTLNTGSPKCGVSRSSIWLPIGSTFQFSAIDCEDDVTPAADLQVRWSFGDGTPWTSYSTTKDTSHAYAARGAYWVHVEISDGTYAYTTKVPVVTGQVVQIDETDFIMGRDTGTTPWPNQEPSRTVHVSRFYIDAFEVTNAEYAAFLSDGNMAHYWVFQDIVDNSDGTFSPEPGAADRPVADVSWFSAAAYCAWSGRRLPTEAEWECAARGPSGGTNYQFPWGDALASSISPIPANFAMLVGESVDVENYTNGVTAWDPAKSIYQLAGNVKEWVNDYYDPDYYQWANDNDDNENPTGPSSSPFAPAEPAYRATRGGSFASSDDPLRVSFREYADPWLRTDEIGFRCAVTSLP
jgi:sulfatase modifying factor 1